MSLRSKLLSGWANTAGVSKCQKSDAWKVSRQKTSVRREMSLFHDSLIGSVKREGKLRRKTEGMGSDRGVLPVQRHCVNKRSHRARKTHGNIFSRVAQGHEKGSRSYCHSVLLSFLKQSSSRAHVMSHTLLDHAPFSLQHETPISQSLLYPPNRTHLCAPQPGLMFGRFAE